MRKIIYLFIISAIFNFNFAGNLFANPCEKDAKQYCSDIQPGGGRIKDCLKDHFDQPGVFVPPSMLMKLIPRVKLI